MAANVSVVIATYSGEEHIQTCLKSLLDQTGVSEIGEVIVVVDGPVPSLKHKAEAMRADFEAVGVKLKVTMFKQNQGRFTARYEGARLARFSQLLFVDDRVRLDEQFLDQAIRSKAAIMIANAIEFSEPVGVNRVLHLVRHRLFAGKTGRDFKSYYINQQNFEKSPKGTAGFWVDKTTFLRACAQITSAGGDTKSVNEDTRLFRAILDQDKEILKSSEAVVYYQPRTRLKEQLKHLYERGPRFTNYYLRPGARFFRHLLVFFGILVITPISLVLMPQLTIYYGLAILTILAASSFYLARRLGDIFAVLVYLPLMAAALISGIIKGVIVILRSWARSQR